MSPKGRPNYARPDKNAREIIEELRSLGFDVDVMPLPNNYDLLVSGEKKFSVRAISEHGPGVDFWTPVAVRVEVKQPGQKLNENEEDYWDKQNHKGNLIIAETVEDILAWFGCHDS